MSAMFQPPVLTPAFGHILPRENATPLEIGLDIGLEAPVLDIPVPIRDLWRWDTCPTRLLPWLAYAMSVDIWDERWAEEKKRDVIRRSFALHRLKGTLGGQRAYIDIAGSTLYRAIRPPAKNFLGSSTTLAEKEAFVEKLPQIRIFPARRTANAGFRGFWRGRHGPWFQDRTGRPDCFPSEVDRRSKETTRAVYVYKNLTQELSWAKISDNGEQISIPASARRSVYSSRGFVGRGFFRKSDAKERIVTLNLERTSSVDQLLHRFPIVPKLDAINVVPFRVYQKGFAPRSVFSGTEISHANRVTLPGGIVRPPPALPNGGAKRGKRYFYRSGARYRVYDTVYLKPKDLIVEGRQAHNFMGRERFGIPDFTAEMKVIVPGKRPKMATSRFIGGHFYTAPKDNLNAMVEASRIAKSARDDILIDTTVFRPLQIGNSLIIGAPLVLGQYTIS